jgi:hypothetical protein
MSWGDVAAQGGTLALTSFTDANGRSGVNVIWSGYSLPSNRIREIEASVTIAAGGCMSPEATTLTVASKHPSVSTATITVTGSNPNAITVRINGTFAAPGVTIPAGSMTLFRCFYTSPIGSSNNAAVLFAPFTPRCRNTSNTIVAIGANTTPVGINTTGTISGTITRADGQDCTGANFGGLIDATVEVISDEQICTNLSSVTTNSDGDYFLQVKRGVVGYDIKPTKVVTSTPPMNIFKCGLNSADGPRISQHILGTVPFTTKWEYFTADFNSSRTVTSFDIVLINRVIANVNEFGVSPFVPPVGITSPWRFLDQTEYNAATFGTLPVMTEIVFNKVIPEPAGSLTQNFVALKRGNVSLTTPLGQPNGVCVDCSVSMYNNNPEDRFDSDLNRSILLSSDQLLLKRGKQVRIPIRVSDFNDITGFTLGIKLDERFMNIESVEMGELPLDWGAIGVDKTQNKAKLAWTGAKIGGYTLEPSSVLCYINAFVHQDGELKDALTIVSDEDLGSSWINNDWESSTFEWADTQLSNTNSLDTGLKLLAAPNPFSEQVTITYHLPVAGEAILRLVDINGREVARTQQSVIDGWHQWLPDLSTYPAGLYGCYLEINGQTSVVKLLKQ